MVLRACIRHYVTSRTEAVNTQEMGWVNNKGQASSLVDLDFEGCPDPF